MQVRFSFYFKTQIKTTDDGASFVKIIILIDKTA